MSDYAAYFLPFDPTGYLSSNFIPGSYTILSLADPQYQQITLRQGLFFNNDLTVVHYDTGETLTEGEDYYFSYYYNDFKEKYNKDVFNSIVITNKKLSGTLLITAHFVGGDFSNLEDALIPAILNNDTSGYTYQYDDILDKPLEFPVTTHKVHTSELTTGFDDVVTALWAINESIIALGGLPPTIDISQVNGLQEELNLRVSTNRYNKLGVAELVEILPDGDHYVQITLALPTADTLLAIELNKLQQDKNEKTFLLSGSITSSPSAGSDDYSVPISDIKARVFNDIVVPEIYSALNVDGAHFFIGPFAKIGEESDKNTLSLFLRKCLYTLGIDVDASPFIAPATLALLSNSELPSGITQVTDILLDNSHKHDIDDIEGLEEKLDELSFTTPYIYVDDPATLPEIKALSGYIFDCVGKTYSIATPTVTRHDKPIVNGDTLSVQIKDLSEGDDFVVLLPTGDDLIMGENKGFALKNNYSTTTFTLSEIDGKKDWRITSVVGEIDTSDTNRLEKRIIGEDISYKNVVGQATFFGKDNLPMTEGNGVVDLNGHRLTPQNDYLINANGSITLIDDSGDEYPITEADQILTITIFILEDKEDISGTSSTSNNLALIAEPLTLYKSTITIDSNIVTEHLSVGFSSVKLRSTGVLRYTFTVANPDYNLLIPELIVSSGVPGKQTKVEELTRTSTYIDFQFSLDGVYTPQRVSLILN